MVRLTLAACIAQVDAILHFGSTSYNPSIADEETAPAGGYGRGTERGRGMRLTCHLARHPGAVVRATPIAAPSGTLGCGECLPHGDAGPGQAAAVGRQAWFSGYALSARR
ncbi:hypothetical protein MRX96_054563 [Rhipicephalus microplus]